MWDWLKKFYQRVLGPAGDTAALASLAMDLSKLYDNVYQRLPEEARARLKRGDSFNQFADAVASLEPYEREAIRALLRALRSNQRAQERFIIRAVVNGGLGNPEPTLRLLRDLATMDTTEAIEYLQDLDFTQPSVTEPEQIRDRAVRLASATRRFAVRAWGVWVRTWNRIDYAMAPEIGTMATRMDQARIRWEANNYGIEEPIYRRLYLLGRPYATTLILILVVTILVISVIRSLS